MIGWLRRLFTGEPKCQHEYETIRELRVSYNLRGDWQDTEIHLKCKKCGWVCKRTL